METVTETIINAFANNRDLSDRDLVLNIMRNVEAEVNVGIISDASQNLAEALTTQTNGIADETDGQLFVSSVTFNNVWVLQNLTQNVTLSELEDPWQGVMSQRRRIILSRGNLNEDYLTTFRLPEDIIVIRYILDFRQLENGVQHSTQIIWNSRFSWREIMQHLQENTYNFNFKPEIMTIALNYFAERVERSSPAQVVDGLPDVINRVEDNAEGDEVICAICYEKFGNGETAKQLQCNHLYHSHCILSWFSHNISCPTCRHEPLSPQR